MSIINTADPEKIQYFAEQMLGQSFRSVQDAWRAWLQTETSSTGSLYDLEMRWLGSQGRTGSLYDRWRQECIAAGYTQLFPEAINAYLTNPSAGTWTVDGLEYSTRKKITIDHTNVDSDLTDFPLLVKFTSDSDISAGSNADGFDHRFTASDGTTLLKYERESYSAGTGVYWVKVPTVAGASNTDIYLYYRTTDTADGADAANVWDSNFLAVYHFKEGSGTSAADSKGGTSFTLSGSPTWSATGPAKGSLDFDGSNDNTNSIAAAYNGFSCTIVARRDDSIDAFGTVFGFKANYASLTAWNNNDVIFLNTVAGGVGTISNKWVDDSAFHYIGFRQSYVDASTVTRYFNFDSDAKVTYGPGAYDVMTHYKLGDLISGLNRRFKGSIDEFRLSTTVRSDDWVKFERANILESDNEISFGAEETP